MTFDGFPTPTKNFFSMPNAITDIIADITNMAELKVILYVIRHTWGFHEYGKPKAISVDEFMNGRRTRDGKGRMDKGTGLSHHSVIDGLKRAVEHEYLICEVDDSDLARVKKSYSLKMASEEATPGEEFAPPEEFAPGEESTPQQCNICTTGVKNLHHSSAESSDRSKKDTLERHSKKDTEEKQSVYSANETEPATTDANASTHAPVFHDEPYRPDFTASQARSEQDSVADENESHSQLSTCAVDKPRQHGAKVASSETASQAALMDAPMVEKPAKARTSSRKKASAPAAPPEKPVYPAADATWNTTTCLALFDFWRGAPLLRKHECMEASHCAKGLAENYTRKQVETVRRWMVERDPYWSQRASGVDICQVASHIHRMLADIKAARVAKQKESASPPEMSTIELLRAEKMRYAQGGIQA